MKTCNRCKTPKDPGDFSRLKSGKMGLNSWCKKCRAEHSRIKYHAMTDEEKRNRELNRLRTLARYGIRTVDYYRMFDLQEGRCAICGNWQTSKRLSVDHDHASGTVRGLLCNGCNTGIGYFKENTQVMLLAINYLRKHSTAPDERVRIVD